MSVNVAVDAVGLCAWFGSGRELLWVAGWFEHREGGAD